VRAAPAVSCAKCTEKSAHEHTGSAEAIRHSLRNGFTAYAVLSPATNSSCHRRCRLDGLVDPVGSTPPPTAWHQQRVSGPHGFAVRNKRRSSCAPSFAHEKIALRTTCRADAAASTASPPAFVTIAKRPFPGRDVASDSADLPDGLSGIFFAQGLDSPNHLEMPAKISLYAHWIFDPIYANHAPHLASLEILRLQFDWFAMGGAAGGMAPSRPGSSRIK
jgi:hypothetical protein